MNIFLNSDEENLYFNENSDKLNNNNENNFDLFNNFYRLLCIVSLFYTVLAIQYLFLQIYNRIDLNNCFFNHKCHTTFHSIYAFNNVSSNLIYILLGSIFLLIVYYSSNKIENTNSIYKNTGLIISLGISMILEGFFSSIFHLCPSETNFQFDTTYMIIFSCLMGVYLLQRRRKELVFDPYSCFLFFGFLNILNVLDLRKSIIHYQWIPITITLIITSFRITNNIYFGRLSWYDSCKNSLVLLKQWFTNPQSPENLAIFINLIIINIVNITCLIICNYNDYHLSTIILIITILNNSIQIVYYIIMKLYNNESMNKFTWLLGFTIIPIWISALYFYSLPTSDKSLTHIESDKLNTPCVLLNFFDTHDIWHFLSGIGMFLSLIFVWFIDWDIRNEDINDINIF